MAHEEKKEHHKKEHHKEHKKEHKHHEHAKLAKEHLAHAEHHHKKAKLHMAHVAKHTDMKEDKKLIHKMVKPSAMKHHKK